MTEFSQRARSLHTFQRCSPLHPGPFRAPLTCGAFFIRLQLARMRHNWACSDICAGCSVERVTEFSQIAEVEKPAHIPAMQPPADWPTQGAIELRDLVIRYRPHLPPVLKGINLSIRGREKVCIYALLHHPSSLRALNQPAISCIIMSCAINPAFHQCLKR